MSEPDIRTGDLWVAVVDMEVYDDDDGPHALAFRFVYLLEVSVGQTIIMVTSK